MFIKKLIQNLKINLMLKIVLFICVLFFRLFFSFVFWLTEIRKKMPYKKKKHLVTLNVPEDSHSIRSSLAGTSVASHGSSETFSIEDTK